MNLAMSKPIHIPIGHREFPPSYVQSERIRKLELEFQAKIERIWSENDLQINQKQPIQPSAPRLSTFNTIEYDFNSSNIESGNNEDNLFCAPEEYTLKGCCICLLSRCSMIAHFVMFLSFLSNTIKSCTCPDCTKRTNNPSSSF